MVKIKSRPQTARAAKVVVVSNPKVVDSSSTGSTRNKHSALLARGVMAAQRTVNPSVESSNLSEPAEHYEKIQMRAL